MIRLEKKHIWTLIIGLFVLAALSFIFYYGVILKIDERNSTLHGQLLSIQTEEPVEEETPVELGNELVALSKKVPVSALEEQIIIDLEEGAIGSDSVILSIGFNENAVEEQTEETDLEDVDTAEEYIEEMKPEEKVVQNNIAIPSELNQIDIALTVRSKDYAALTGFLENIRKLPRIYVVESFSFNGFEEYEVRPGPLEDELEYTVQLTSYYAPIIEELAVNSGIVLPEPSGKENPLHDVREEQPDIMDGWVEDEPGLGMTLEEFLELISQNKGQESDETSSDEESTTETDSPTDEEQTAEPRQYTVQRGDTLFSISMKFYGNREGEVLIKEANHKKSDIVIIGETLIIP